MDVQINCPCPGTPHPGGDTVTLLDALDFRQATRIRVAVSLMDDDERQDAASVLAMLQEQYLLHCIASWTLTAADGAAAPVTPASVRQLLLSHVAQASIVADVADELYADDVLAPLLARAVTSSPSTPTDAPTSATTGSQPVVTAQPTPSKRSSTTTSRTADTVAATA